MISHPRGEPVSVADFSLNYILVASKEILAEKKHLKKSQKKIQQPREEPISRTEFYLKYILVTSKGFWISHPREEPVSGAELRPIRRNVTGSRKPENAPEYSSGLMAVKKTIGR
ncbi:hypothetical protein J6590_053960 [Homalodisca vitripennis]|nr:hypothetical protein J6590_053960 [Homalodisca vitripennis]